MTANATPIARTVSTHSKILRFKLGPPWIVIERTMLRKRMD